MDRLGDDVFTIPHDKSEFLMKDSVISIILLYRLLLIIVDIVSSFEMLYDVT